MFPGLTPDSMGSMEAFGPVLAQLGFGGVAGWISGYTLKKIGKLLALVLGFLFISVQLLAYAGYLEVNWTRIQQDVEPLFKQESLKGFWQKLLEVLTYNLPFASGFAAGLVLGFRRG